jgi:hypothetical protein
MTRYIFSNGRITVDERVNLKPNKRHHPLRSSPIWIRLPEGMLVPLVQPDMQREKAAK